MFFIICLIIRYFLTYYVKTNDVPQFMLYIAGLISFGFMFLYVTGFRQTGMEVSDKSKIIWWNHLRPFHSIMYLTFILLTIKNNSYNWLPLFIDTSVGLMAYLLNYY